VILPYAYSAPRFPSRQTVSVEPEDEDLKSLWMIIFEINRLRTRLEEDAVQGFAEEGRSVANEIFVNDPFLQSGPTEMLTILSPKSTGILSATTGHGQIL
jgi:hypothetical protein